MRLNQKLIKFRKNSLLSNPKLNDLEKKQVRLEEHEELAGKISIERWKMSSL